MKPTPADIDLVEHAAAIIDGNALSLIASSTSATGDWDSDGDEAEYKYMKSTVTNLYALADRMRGKP